jgi:hypothetical protein
VEERRESARCGIRTSSSMSHETRAERCCSAFLSSLIYLCQSRTVCKPWNGNCIITVCKQAGLGRGTCRQRVGASLSHSIDAPNTQGTWILQWERQEMGRGSSEGESRKTESGASARPSIIVVEYIIIRVQQPWSVGREGVGGRAQDTLGRKVPAVETLSNRVAVPCCCGDHPEVNPQTPWGSSSR